MTFANDESTSMLDSQSKFTDHFRKLHDVRFPPRDRVDIEFKNLHYNVRRFSFSTRKFVTKEILHGVNGVFRSGELTSIMGPSGSGKTTLLNVISGFRATGVSGKVQVNGVEQSTATEKYRRLSCYIHQDDLLRSMLTVGEIMIIAAHLKLGFKVSKEYKQKVVKKILVLLGLDIRFNTLTGKLSGGQKKRLSIALELISNPSVLYMDEPTTGLDSSSSVQLLSLLKTLAKHGRTIVCTIHQPSALMFEMFDKLYAVAEGNCIYQGPVKELVPFLRDMNFHCPSFHNPADYLLELAVGDYERDLEKMINASNKKYFEDSDFYQIERVNQLINNIQGTIENEKTTNPSEIVEKEKLLNCKSNYKQQQKQQQQCGNDREMEKLIGNASLFMQYILLLGRILICSKRNSFSIGARILSHMLIGTVFGYLYLNVGPKATAVLGNYVYLYGTILLLVYTGKMAVVLSFPLEMDMLSREHFNRWYKLGPYFLSLISFEIPFQCFCVALYIVISYYLTGNNSSESFRFYYFLLFAVMASLSAQAWGFFVGATLPTKLAVFAGPILAVLFSVFGFCTRYIDITPILRWMWHISYFRAGFHGSLNAIYGMNRSTLECPEGTMYCHFRNPKVFLTQMMISDVSTFDCISLMSSVIIIMHILTITTLWFKLTKR